MAEILIRGAGEYVRRYPDQAVPHVQSTLAKLSVCRTSALGSRWYRCEHCDRGWVVYNSCGDRHCPRCGGAKRADWLASTSAVILEGVPHFHVVFTLPRELSALALGNRRALFDLLLRSAWEALKGTIEEEQGFDCGVVLVLHTWNQKLEAHVHAHALVAGGGPSLSGDGWRWAMRSGDGSSVGRYLVDAESLRGKYRERFLAGLDRLYEKGELKLEGRFAHLRSAERWRCFMERLRGVAWVSYIEPPPRSDGRAESVLKYLARYLTGGPISDRRIVWADEREVTFLARAGAQPGGDRKQIPITLPLVEFVRRWCLHILPKGFTKVRFYGGWSARRRGEYLERCCHMLEATDAPLGPDALEFGPFDSGEDSGDEGVVLRCPACGHRLILQGETARPGWGEVMASAHRPWWYGASDSRSVGLVIRGSPALECRV